MSAEQPPTADVSDPVRGPLTGFRRTALIVYIAISGFLLLGIWAAFFLAGSGVFGDVGDDLDPHRTVGHVLAYVVLVMLIAVLVARPGMPLVIGTVVLLLLVEPGQPLLADADERWVAALHVLDAGIILALGFWLHLRARKVPRT